MIATSAVLKADAGRKRGRPLVEGEFHFTAEDFRRIAAMLHADAGIALTEGKATLVYSRLGKRLRTLGLRDFSDYCAVISGKDGAGERRHMLTALTTNVTRFFREPHHFEHLKSVVLPPLVELARRGGRVRLWSAACSTGQEPYSLALTLLALMPDAAQFDIKVLGTDIDPNVLAHGSAGCYTNDCVAAVPPALRQRWFVRDGSSEWRVADELRGIVRFRELNLIGSWPMKCNFQVIMCRNVVIYFNEDTQVMIWDRFASMIENGGHLYIGHSERLTGKATQYFENAGCTTYQRCEGSRP